MLYYTCPVYRHQIKEMKEMNDMEMARDRELQEGGCGQFLLVKTREEKWELSTQSIVYVEAMSHGCVIEFCTQSGSTFQVETIEDISELEKELGEPDFARCHRYYLCRIDKIRYISRAWIEMDNGSRIPVSRKVYTNVNQMYIRHLRKKKEKNRR